MIAADCRATPLTPWVDPRRDNTSKGIEPMSQHHEPAPDSPRHLARACAEAALRVPVQLRGAPIDLAAMDDDGLAELAHGVKFEIDIRLRKLDGAAALFE